MVKTKVVIALATIVIIVVASFAVYAGASYPRTTVNTQVSFTVGADSKTTAFNQPIYRRQSTSDSYNSQWRGIMAGSKS